MSQSLYWIKEYWFHHLAFLLIAMLVVLNGCNEEGDIEILEEEIEDVEEDIAEVVDISSYYGIDDDVHSSPINIQSGCRVSRYIKTSIHGVENVEYVYDSIGRIIAMEGSNPQTFEYDSIGRYMYYIDFNDSIYDGIIYMQDTIKELTLDEYHFDEPTIVNSKVHWEFNENRQPLYSEELGSGVVWLSLSMKTYLDKNLKTEENLRGLARWYNKSYTYDTLLMYPFPVPGPFVDRHNAYLWTESDDTIYNFIHAYRYSFDGEKINITVTVIAEDRMNHTPTTIEGQILYEIYFECDI